ncbi:G-protein coupled receptor family C group 6 member A-like [Chanos chanos]|uniref:G-protein coupled receptor family C group 6 member A n=1 Tax=Chanos chanos TaxID=29144 RepID=A0A6J2VZP5_CHACN|nr:G-protein coupled receptor family C group 6 member A-like [Chanos chanos]
MAEAVEEINNSSMLGNLTLGYVIVDSCSDVTHAVQLSETYLCGRCRTYECGNDSTNTLIHNSGVKAVVGAYHSEISVAVARQLTTEYIPQISYGSTAGILSDKTRFPTFLRTVPEDNHQAQAIVQILVRYGWTWVGLVTTDGDYGRYAADRFEWHAREHGICTAFRVVLPDVLQDKRLSKKINETVEKIADNPNAKVIVSFAKPDHMMYIMGNLSGQGLDRVWVASDNWATSSRVLRNCSLREVGTIIGVTLKSSSESTSQFKRFLQKLDLRPNIPRNNSILQHFLRKEMTQHKNMTAREILMSNTYGYSVFSIKLAVKAIASAVSNICAKKICRGGDDIQPWELSRALRETSFSMDGESWKFNQDGDMDTGYDIVLWEEGNKTQRILMGLVGNYSIQNKPGLSLYSDKRLSVLKSIVSKCNGDCVAGHKKVVLDKRTPCCFTCENCTVNTFSNITNADTCLSCPEHEYSHVGSPNCTKKTVEFLGWRDQYAIILLFFAALGVLLTLLVLVMFVVWWNTPVVRAACGPISVLLLISLVGTFTSTVLFAGKPNDIQCQTREVLFALSFTLCVSCILVKSLTILLAFEFNPAVKQVLGCLFKPYIILAVLVMLQGLICALWLTFCKPTARIYYEYRPDQSLYECNVQCDNIYFGIVLGYIGLLALIGFIFAFASRKLPNSYNEAKFITFGMLIYIICWVVFGPIYVSDELAKYKPAVEMTVILISAYGIFFCHFMPKVYIILFRKESNTREAFRKDVREYSARPIKRDSQSLRSSLSNGHMLTSLQSAELTEKFPGADPSVNLDQDIESQVTDGASNVHAGGVGETAFQR